jgi:hypothetical protein
MMTTEPDEFDLKATELLPCEHNNTENCREGGPGWMCNACERRPAIAAWGRECFQRGATGMIVERETQFATQLAAKDAEVEKWMADSHKAKH